MAWIRTAGPEEGDESLRQAYAAARTERGGVANIFRIHSLNPAVMLSHLRLYGDLMFGPSELTRSEREMLAVAVSSLNGCRY